MFHELVAGLFFVLFPLFGVVVLAYALWRVYREVREGSASE